MKLKYLLPGVMTLLFLYFSLTVTAQTNKTADKVERLKKMYNSLTRPEITLQEFLKIHSADPDKEFVAFNGCGIVNDACSNGGFEGGLDPNQWQGAYGVWTAGDPDPLTLTTGLLSGDLFNSAAHQTVVSVGVDPIIGIPTVGDSGETQSLRLGNAVTGAGTELISKTIVVTPQNSIYSFTYAVVFQDPGHPYDDQPAFSVRAFDCATGLELPDICNLGDGSYKIVSDADNPFFQNANTSSYGLIAYRDWTNAFVDLSAYIGRTVNIQFTNKDCGQSGHFGYTYLDNFCSSTPDSTGSVSLNIARTDTCGVGSICVDYVLGKALDGTVGTAVLNLEIYQSGSLVTSISTDTLRNDSSTYCFAVNPASLGLDNSLGGFDYVITSTFVLKGFPYVVLPVGSVPDGQLPGANNDYRITCGGGNNCNSVCLFDEFSYKWDLCYKQKGNKRILKGTVDIQAGYLWDACGWWDCKTGKLELHAINPRSNNCASGYTDSFTYYGTGNKFTDTASKYFYGAGKWVSYCGGSIDGRGTFSIADCAHRNILNSSGQNGATPGRSKVADEDITLKVSPNPMQHTATINYKTGTESKIRIVVYDYMLQPVKTLVNEKKPAGSYTVSWNGTKSTGGNVQTGLYKIVMLVNDKKSYTTTLQVLK